MAVVIRLQRFGKRTQPHYRIVAIEKKRGPFGKPLEVLGHYNPRADKLKDKVHIKAANYEKWIKCGARTSQTVSSLVKKISQESDKV